MKKTLKTLLVVTLLATMLLTLLPTGASADKWYFHVLTRRWTRCGDTKADTYWALLSGGTMMGPFKTAQDVYNYLGLCPDDTTTLKRNSAAVGGSFAFQCK